MPAVRFLPTAVLLSGWVNGEGRRSGQRRREDRRKWNGRAPPPRSGIADCLSSFFSLSGAPESVFESTWKEMGTKDNSWLNRLYESRNKWSAAFGGGIFSWSIRLTQKSEGLKNIFWLMPANSMNLIGFVHHYEQQVKYIRETEVQDDHNS